MPGVGLALHIQVASPIKPGCRERLKTTKKGPRIIEVHIHLIPAPIFSAGETKPWLLMKPGNTLPRFVIMELCGLSFQISNLTLPKIPQIFAFFCVFSVEFRLLDQESYKSGKKVIVADRLDDYYSDFGYKDFNKGLPKLNFKVLKMVLTGLANSAE